MPHRAAVAALALASVAAGCAGDAAQRDPARVEVREPGDGSGTLHVEALVKAEATAPNAAGPGRFRTRSAVAVKRAGTPVTDALVRVNDVALAHRGGGLYAEGSPRPGLPDEVVVLSVRAGNDWVNGAVSSPGAHAFTRPARGGEVLAAPFEIEWVRGARADGASIEVAGLSVAGDLDDGRWIVPAHADGLRPGAAAQCAVRRENRVALRGGAAGSSLAVSVSNGIEVSLAGR